MRIAITGSSGLIGSALVSDLTASGHKILRLVRTQAQSPEEVFWNPEASVIDSQALEGIDAVVHLAGESIASGRWTAKRKEILRDSREQGTLLLARTLAELKKPPSVLISASAIGYYGDRGNLELDETNPPGRGFLSEVCQAWEDATAAARAKGIRVVNFRIGIVLSSRGGALAKMLPPFRMGVGGKIGSGSQPMSWISLDDVVGAVSYCLSNKSLYGPVNAVAPGAVSNAEFTRILGRVLGRPAFLPLPAFAVRLAFGEMGDALLLGGAKVKPRRLLETGYVFRQPGLEGALRHTLGKEK